MFCPKCGSQNSDETKFCRGCGADISRVLAVTLTAQAPPRPSHHPVRETRPPLLGQEGSYAATPAISTTPAFGHPSYPGGELSTTQQQIELSSRGWRGLMLGVGFLIISALGFGWSSGSAVLGFFALAFAFICLATGISRFVQAKGLKRLLEPRDSEPAAA